MDNEIGQDLLDDIQAAAQDVQQQIKAEIRRNYILRIAGPLLVLAFLYMNRKGR